MSRHTTKKGQRVDKVRASDGPHDLYRGDGTPVLVSTPIGNVLEKDIVHVTVTCPDCDISVYYDGDGEPVCDECGLICTGRQGTNTLLADQLVRDAKAAGRLPPSN